MDGVAKRVTTGTHRAVSAEDTWARVRPLLPSMGITRVAEITALDVIGIPVFQAIRPNARTLSVSQGKGITRQLARVSSVMESIELWHAEQPASQGIEATVGQMAEDLPYAVADLPLASRSVLSSATRLRWVPARSLAGGGTTWLPEACVRLDGTDPSLYNPPLFYCSSNGLASGNTVEEALLHALYEVVEREARARAGTAAEDRVVDQTTVTGSSRGLLDRLRDAAVSVRIADLGDVVGIACYEALIWSRTVPVRFAGWGCHRDPDVALCRALTEAAQSRLTMIAGARDDIDDVSYHWLQSRAVLRDPFPGDRGSVPFDQGSGATGSFDDDLEAVRRVVEKLAVGGALWADLSHPDVGVPVVRVVVPGLRVPRSGH